MRRLALVAVSVAVLAGCGGKRQTAAQPAPLPRGSIVLPALAAQGLVVDGRRGVSLIGLDGRVFKRLARFHTYPRNGGTRDFLIQNLDQAGPTGQPRLVGPRHRWYRLDWMRHALIPVRTPRVPLAGGADLVAHGNVDDEGGVGFDGYTVERGGKTVFALDRDLRLAAGRFLQTRGRLVDLRTRVVWPVPQRCYVGGVRAGAVLAVCQKLPRNSPPALTVVRIAPNGTQHVLARLPAMFVTDVALSPDGKTLAAHMSPGCGAGYVFLAPTVGGAPRVVSGGRWDPEHAPYSELLGWARDGHVVVHIEEPACDRSVKSGTYLVDPVTLTRTLLVKPFATMWNPYPG